MNKSSSHSEYKTNKKEAFGSSYILLSCRAILFSNCILKTQAKGMSCVNAAKINTDCRMGLEVRFDELCQRTPGIWNVDWGDDKGDHRCMIQFAWKKISIIVNFKFNSIWIWLIFGKRNSYIWRRILLEIVKNVKNRTNFQFLKKSFR